MFVPNPLADLHRKARRLTVWRRVVVAAGITHVFSIGFLLGVDAAGWSIAVEVVGMAAAVASYWLLGWEITEARTDIALAELLGATT